jgi:hypothetical protein
MISMETLQEVSSQIVNFIKSSPGQTCLGVHLGIFLKNTVLGFSPLHYQCRNLRQFIRVHVTDVSEVGRAGLDIRYGVGQTVTMPLGTTSAVIPPVRLPVVDFVSLPVDPPDWKAYANPGHPFSIAVNGETGEIETVPDSSTPSAPWVVIPKPSTEVHHGIATDFVSTLPFEAQPVFRRALTDPRWYVHFSGLAKQQGVAPQWAAFRRTRLIEAFNTSLRELGVSISPRALRGRGASSDVSLRVADRTFNRAQQDEASFRELMQRVVAELPIGELRLLKLPVGVVFDAFKK